MSISFNLVLLSYNATLTKPSWRFWLFVWIWDEAYYFFGKLRWIVLFFLCESYVYNKHKWSCSTFGWISQYVVQFLRSFLDIMFLLFEKDGKLKSPCNLIIQGKGEGIAYLLKKIWNVLSFRVFESHSFKKLKNIFLWSLISNLTLA